VAAFDRNAWPRSIGLPGRNRRNPQIKTMIEIPDGRHGLDFEHYKAKVRQFLTEPLNHIALQKVRQNFR